MSVAFNFQVHTAGFPRLALVVDTCYLKYCYLLGLQLAVVVFVCFDLTMPSNRAESAWNWMLTTCVDHESVAHDRQPNHCSYKRIVPSQSAQAVWSVADPSVWSVDVFCNISPPSALQLEVVAPCLRRTQRQGGYHRGEPRLHCLDSGGAACHGYLYLLPAPFCSLCSFSSWRLSLAPPFLSPLAHARPLAPLGSCHFFNA